MSLSNQKGVSLIEILLVVLIVGFIILFIVNLPRSISLISLSRQTQIAKEIARKQIETLRSKNFSNLSNGTTPISDSNLSKLKDGTGSVVIDPCPLNICSSESDPLYQKIKKIRVEVTWNQQNQIKLVSLVTLISEGGLK